MNFQKIKKMFYSLIIIIVLISIITVIFLNTAPFGKLPSGERLARIEKSPNYKEGKFRNMENTPQFTSEKSFLRNVYEFLFVKEENTFPTEKISAEQTN